MTDRPKPIIMKTIGNIPLTCLLIGMLCCGPVVSWAQHAPAKTSKTVPYGKQQLADDLTAGTYGEFFLYPAHETSIDKVWAKPGNPALLEQLIRDEAMDPKARFLACVVLFAKEFTFVSRYNATEVAKIYAHALEENYTGFANPWGLLYDNNDEGPIGITFIILGEPAVPALLPLLRNDRPFAGYIGSEEATVGNGQAYRIKDVAAYYIAKIRNIPIPYFRDVRERDKQIAEWLEKTGK